MIETSVNKLNIKEDNLIDDNIKSITNKFNMYNK